MTKPNLSRAELEIERERVLGRIAVETARRRVALGIGLTSCVLPFLSVVEYSEDPAALGRAALFMSLFAALWAVTTWFGSRRDLRQYIDSFECVDGKCVDAGGETRADCLTVREARERL